MIRFITYSVQPYNSDDSVVVSREISIPAGFWIEEACAHEIAGDRNIAALWDIERVMLDGEDVTRGVKDIYDRVYVSRRPEFLQLMEQK